MYTGGAHQEARRAGDSTKSPKPEAPKFVGLSTVAATSCPSCRNGNFDADGGSVRSFHIHSCSSQQFLTYVSRHIQCIHAGPNAFAIDGSMEELVDGRIPRHGITLRSDSASQLRREPGHQMLIPPSMELITLPQCLVVPYRMMRVTFPKETVAVIASQVAVMEVDRMEETAEMGMEMVVETAAHHLLPRRQEG